MKDRIKEIMGYVFEINPNQITNDSSPSTIQSWDSLRHINLIVALEEEFNIKFTDEDILQMLNFELIVIIVNEKI
jgi:acyl carrier protein